MRSCGQWRIDWRWAALRTSHPSRINSLQSVLALRLLRAFRDMTDLRTKEVLLLLAEQIVRCQASRRGDGG
jgi:hypothetical protein